MSDAQVETTGGEVRQEATGDQGGAQQTQATTQAGDTGADDQGGQQASKTLADGGATDKEISAPADWPADWRAKLAGEDAKALKRLERFGSIGDVFKSFREMEAKMSSGKGKEPTPAPGPDASPEDLAAWRKEAGIPESPDKYDTDLGKGFVWADADKPMLDDYTKWAHERNMTPAQVKDNLAWYAALQNRQAEAIALGDQQFRRESEDGLRTEWGPDFRRNMNAINTLFADLPPEARETFFTARTADGRLIGDNPMLAKFWARLANELHPAASILPQGNGDPMKGISGRKSEIETLMADRGSAYWKGPNAVAMQQEYRDLLTAEEKLSSRAA